MMENSLFTHYQHGFMAGKSCVTQLLKVIDQCSDMFDTSNNIDIHVVYFIFQKAFDTDPHIGLVNKLHGR